MKQKMKQILEKMQQYNVNDMALLNFGLDKRIIYDALVVAPGWKPTNILQETDFQVSTLATHSYISGYLVQKEHLKIAWIQIASGASNLLDHLTLCAELQFKKLIFVGAVGSLTDRFHVGDICTPSYSVAGVYANSYLEENIFDYKPFQKVYPDDNYIDAVITKSKTNNIKINKASVFCTDSIALEYYHLDEIKKFNTDLIEMETSTFYLLSDLLEVPAIALLVVSDNSAVGHPLVGRNKELQLKYNFGRRNLIPKLIEIVAKMD